MASIIGNIIIEVTEKVKEEVSDEETEEEEEEEEEEEDEEDEEEEIDQEAMKKEFMDYAANLKRALEQSFPDDTCCGLCAEELEEDENMGACGCGGVTRMCQLCGAWCVSDSEWKCGAGLCVVKKEQCRFCIGKEHWTKEDRASCLTCLKGDV